ncbi:hypothetical protein FOZ63_017570, partial [Perkinsus olseni]
MAIVASSSSPAVVVADGSCDHDYSSSATMSTFDESEDASSARHHLDGLSNELASIVGLCHPLLDLVATIDDFETYGLEPATQRLAKGGVARGSFSEFPLSVVEALVSARHWN